MGDVVVHLLTPNNQRLSAAQQRKPEARTSIAADKPCWTEPPVMRWCELFWLKGIRTKPPLASRDYDPERHGIDTQLAFANGPMARSGVASAPPQTGTVLRRPMRPRKVQGCPSARLFGANLPDPFGLTHTPHGGPLG